MSPSLPEDLLARGHTMLRTAQLLLEHADDHASTVSRGYYAMLFAARALLAQKESYPKTHNGVHSEMGRLYVRKGRLPAPLNAAFRHAEDLRLLGDYAAGEALTYEDAEKVVADARWFLEAAEKLLAGDENRQV